MYKWLIPIFDICKYAMKFASDWLSLCQNKALDNSSFFFYLEFGFLKIIGFSHTTEREWNLNYVSNIKWKCWLETDCLHFE